MAHPNALVSGPTAPSPLLAAVGVADADLAALIAGLAAAGVTVAVAESLTGGLLAAVLTATPGASVVVRGGFVSYATDLKNVLVGVDADLLATVGAVHPMVARQLATGARDRCGALWGLGVTGVAGPSAQDGQPVGTVFSCLDADGIVSARADRFPGGRDDVRAAAVRGALALLTDAQRAR